MPESPKAGFLIAIDLTTEQLLLLGCLASDWKVANIGSAVTRILDIASIFAGVYLHRKKSGTVLTENDLADLAAITLSKYGNEPSISLDDLEKELGLSSIPDELLTDEPLTVPHLSVSPANECQRVTLEVPTSMLAVYQEYADKRGCTLEQALMIPIEELVSVMASASQQEIPKRT